MTEGEFLSCLEWGFVLVLSYDWKSILIGNTRRKRLGLLLLKLPSTQKDHINKLWRKGSKYFSGKSRVSCQSQELLWLCSEARRLENTAPQDCLGSGQNVSFVTESRWRVGASGGKMMAYGVEKSDACLCLHWTLFLLKFKPLCYSLPTKRFRLSPPPSDAIPKFLLACSGVPRGKNWSRYNPYIFNWVSSAFVGGGEFLL